MFPRGGFFRAKIYFGAMSSFVLAIFILISCNTDKVNGDYIVNCRTKVRNTLLKYCAGDSGGRRKREADISPPSPASIDNRQMSPQEASRLFDFAAPLIVKLIHGLNHGFQEQSSSRETENGPKLGFPPPMSGDDLGMGLHELSDADLEELYKEMVQRLPRAAKDKGETLKKITAYAARCCNDDLVDSSCSNPASVGDCP